MKRLIATFLLSSSIVFLSYGMDSDNGCHLKIPTGISVEGFCSFFDVSWSAFERGAVVT